MILSLRTISWDSKSKLTFLHFYIFFQTDLREQINKILRRCCRILWIYTLLKLAISFYYNYVPAYGFVIFLFIVFCAQNGEFKIEYRTNTLDIAFKAPSSSSSSSSIPYSTEIYTFFQVLHFVCRCYILATYREFWCFQWE